ncbi:tetratricopeptide repeat protein [Streptomyces sp. NPDC005538]|uniref:tetratricopeptide repeat protein n=1 Tax=unclassified Streptomyces TaxID=2593676 RepID=UPI0033B7BEC2
MIENALSEIGKAAAVLFREAPYRDVGLERVGAAVRLPAPARGRQPTGAGRSLMWVYTVIQGKGQAVALGVATAWQDHVATARADGEAARDRLPETLIEARARVAEAVAAVCRFVRAEGPLCEQLASGLSDLSHRGPAPRSRPKERALPDSLLGRTAAAARHGRCAVFTDWLTTALEEARAAVGWQPPSEVGQAASELSDLAFRIAVQDPSADADTLGRGLSAYWFERFVLGDSGVPHTEALRALDGAEQAVAAMPTGSALAAASSMLRARAALATGIHHRRAAREFRPLAAEFTAAERWEEASDATSRLGLALLRGGDLTGADTEAVRSLDLALSAFGPEDDRVARALTLQAEIAAVAGRPRPARELAERAERARTVRYERQPGQESWRRLTLSRAARVLALCHSGTPSRAAEGAAELLADRRAHLRAGPLTPSGVLDADRLLGLALLEQGDLAGAERVLREALAQRRRRGEEAHTSTQRLVADLARCLLLSGEPEQAGDLLAAAPGLGAWYETTVSFRLSCSMRRYHAESLLARPETPDALSLSGELLEECAELLARHGVTGTDPLAGALARSRARWLTASGRPDEAVLLLRAAAADLPDPAAEGYRPQWAALHRELARLLTEHGRTADRTEARQLLDDVLALPTDLLEPAHPHRLAAHCALLELALDEGRPTDAERLARPFTTPAAETLRIDERHPVLRRARELQARLPEADAGGSVGWDDL